MLGFADSFIIISPIHALQSLNSENRTFGPFRQLIFNDRLIVALFDPIRRVKISKFKKTNLRNEFLTKTFIKVQVTTFLTLPVQDL